MEEGRKYYGADYQRIAFELLSARVADLDPLNARRAVLDVLENRGLRIPGGQGYDVYETLNAMINLTAGFASMVAAAHDRPLAEVVADLATGYEVETPTAFLRGAIQDELGGEA